MAEDMWPHIRDFIFGSGALKKAAAVPGEANAAPAPVTTPGISQSDIGKMAQDQADAMKWQGPRQQKPTPTVEQKYGDRFTKR